MKAANLPRRDRDGIARDTAAMLAGMQGASNAPSRTRKVAVSHKIVGASGVNSTQSDQPAIAPASVRRGPI